jgi:chromosome segregation ATPase
MQITTNIRHYMKSLETAQKALGDAETLLAQEKATLDVRKTRYMWLINQEITDGATQYCPVRIPSDQIRGSVKDIKAKIDALKKQLLRMQNEYRYHISISNLSAGQTEEAVRAKYAEVRNQYQAASQEMKSLETLKEVRLPAGFPYDSLFTDPTISVALAFSTSEHRSQFERKLFLWICSLVVHIAAV